MAERVNPERLLDLARRLVCIPSINPPGEYGRVAAEVEQAMREAGLVTRVVEGEPGKPNVLGILPGSDPARPVLLLSGHMDVVPAGDPGAWQEDPFSGRVVGGYLWGRGTADMKGALAAQVEAARVLAAGRRMPGSLVVAATVDDETAGPMGMKYLIESGWPSGLPLPFLHVLGEANDLNVTVAFKGRVWFRIATRGVAAHGGAPETGVNAVEKMIELFRHLRALPGREHPLMGRDTLNLGTIRGGEKVNIVPDCCEATFDYRVCSPCSAAEAEARFRQVVEKLSREDSEFVVSRFEVFEKRDPLEVDPDGRAVRLVREVVRDVTGREPRLLGTLSAGDAYYVLQKSIPAVWVGPGDSSLLHAANERIAVRDLEVAALVYVELARRACSGGWKKDE
ncbi:MAG: M20 family metallopeptidase [Bacillota bacterium]